jgi:hypothetical protein
MLAKGRIMKLLISVFALLFCFVLTQDIFADSFSIAGGIIHPEFSGNNLSWTLAFEKAVGESWIIEPEFDVWANSFSNTTCLIEGCLSSNSSTRDITAGVNALYRIPRGRFSIFFGPGVGGHFIRNTFATTLTPPNPLFHDRILDNSEVDLGFRLLGGVDFSLSKHLSVFATNRTEFIRHASDTISVFGGIRVHF